MGAQFTRISRQERNVFFALRTFENAMQDTLDILLDPARLLCFEPKTRRWDADKAIFHVDAVVAAPTGAAFWREGVPYADLLAADGMRVLDAAKRLCSVYEHVHGVTLTVCTADHDARTGASRMRTLLFIGVRMQQLRDIDFGNMQPMACLEFLNGRTCGDLRMNSLDEMPTDAGRLPAAQSLDPAQLSPAEFEALVATLLRAMGFTALPCSRLCIRGKVAWIVWLSIRARWWAVASWCKPNATLARWVPRRCAICTERCRRGANKGVLITTGSFGPSGRDFARGKPIELIDGATLRQLIASFSGNDGGEQ